ncbi:Polysaccharide lyase [Aspergillus oryzae]|uniref:Polysaccharide lyase n=1 Tax=Aspergillus oryzae TaxID=5062 RepID=A0A1S9D8I7_ASPOZ|nr:Polysaccharide lyase [Aspergillus oryzae]
MQLYKVFAVLAALQPALAKSLVDFSAARGDNPSILGLRNLESVRNTKLDENTKDLYIKLDKDPKGTPALHFHRKKDYIRAEYHSLKNQIEVDKTYYIGYKFSLGAIQQSLMIWQFKEYSANSHGGANIPLSLEFKSGKLNLQYQASGDAKRVSQWSKELKTDTVYSIGLVINTSRPGWVELYFDGEQQTLSSGSTRLKANTFPGQADPKFGAYRGEEVQIDTYVYNIQIGTTIDDIKEAAGLGSSPKPTATSNPTPVPTCAWEGHCEGATCTTENDCSDELVCKNGKCTADGAVPCSWEGHCEGATCSSENDCSDELVCKNGKCTANSAVTCSWEGHCAGAKCSSHDDCSDELACTNGVCA